MVTKRRLLRVFVALMLASSALFVVGAPTATAAGWTPRGEEYPATETTKSVTIPMSDGVLLKADVMRPADATGTVVGTPLPVIITITAYNKEAMGNELGSSIGGASPAYLAKRGYVHLMVDARGTGTSGGVWQVFGEREQLDAKEIVEWAAQQSWSDGNVGMSGPSYMGISQLFAAGQKPIGLKAIFPQVPEAEVYRDVVASGGQIDVGFMPLWLGLVTLTGLIPPQSAPTPDVLGNIVTHLTGGGAGTLELALSALTGGENAYDGPYYRERSTLLRSVPNIEVPTFLIGGEYDLFQRGTPLVFQGLRERGVPVKMIFGPWDHLQGSSGAEVADAGHGTLSELQLRWFDRWVKDLPDPTLDDDIPNFTYHEIGSGAWIQRDDYLKEQIPQVFHLSGSTTTGGSSAGLVNGDGEAGQSQVVPVALAGLCSRSASQWTTGIDNVILQGANPCLADASLNDRTGVTFDTPAMPQDVKFLGPSNVRLHVSSTTGDGLLALRLERVRPDGTSEHITGGWQVISLRELDETRSVTLPLTGTGAAPTDWRNAAVARLAANVGSEIVQPWHPFTADSQAALAPGEIAPVDVEVFPTGAVIPAGEQLRLSVSTFELPHLAPTLTQLPATAGAVVTIHAGPEHPSRVILPAFTQLPGDPTAPPPAISGPPATSGPAATPAVVTRASGSADADDDDDDDADDDQSDADDDDGGGALPDAGSPVNLASLVLSFALVAGGTNAMAWSRLRTKRSLIG